MGTSATSCSKSIGDSGNLVNNCSGKIRLLRVVGAYAGGVKATVDSFDHEFLCNSDVEIIVVLSCLKPKHEQCGYYHKKREFVVVSGNAKKMELGTAIRVFWKVRETIMVKEINVVCIHSPYMFIANAVVLACIWARVKYLVFYHGGPRQSLIANLKSRMLSFLPKRMASSRIVLTEAGKKLLGRDAHVIPPCIKSPLKTRVRCSDNHGRPFLVLYPARFVKPKGQLDLVEAVRLLRDGDNFVEHKMILVGHHEDKQYVDTIKRRIRDYSLSEYIEVFDYLEQDELTRLYEDATILVFPSYEEGFGRIIVEAGLLGVTCVAYRTGGIEYVIEDGVTGILVETGNITQLAEKMNWVLRDRKLRESMARNAKSSYGARFDADKVSNAFLRILRSTLAGV